MRIFRRLCAAAAAVIVAMSSGVLIAHADDTPSVYTTPGGHISQGRLWNTTCEKYSSTIVRCRAEIWATTVVYSNGGYVSRTGWSFNNLTYLPSSRSSWATNNLGRTNDNWTSGGRKWRTECDTAATGRGGCRTYMLVKTVAVVKSGSGNTYVNKDAWVFNNLVLFSSRSIPAVSTIPAWVVDTSGQWIEPQGLRWGPVRVGSKVDDLQRLGYVRQINVDTTFFYPAPSQALKNRGVGMEYLGMDDTGEAVQWVSVETGFIPTRDGARVGMTVGQVKAIYGANFAVVPKKNDGVEGSGSDQYFGTYRVGEYELQFRVRGDLIDGGEGFYEYAPTRPLVDSDLIAEIKAQRYTEDVSSYRD